MLGSVLSAEAEAWNSTVVVPAGMELTPGGEATLDALRRNLLITTGQLWTWRCAGSSENIK